MAQQQAANRQARRKLATRSAAVQSQPQQITESDVYFTYSKPNATSALLGRMGASFAPPTALAYGNSVVTSDARASAQAAQPGKGGQGSYTDGNNVGNASPYPGPIRPTILTQRSQLNQLAYIPQFQHGRGIARDRHVIENQGRTTSSSQQQQTGGSPNPEKDGPARPAWKMWNRTLSWQIGTDDTRQLDGGQYHAATTAGPGRIVPLGVQGDRESHVYGGTPGLADFRPYGTRGGVYAGAPAPTVYAAAGGPYKPGTVLQQGESGDGPQKVYPGLPWGLHSATVAARKVSIKTAAARFNQVKPVWQNRPLNNKSNGQSYNQQVVTLTGHVPVKVATMNGGRQPGLNARWLGTG